MQLSCWNIGSMNNNNKCQDVYEIYTVLQIQTQLYKKFQKALTQISVNMFKNQRNKQLSRVKIDFSFQQFSAEASSTFFQSQCTTLNNLKADLFPYLSLMSISSLIIAIEIVIFLFIDSSYTTIKPQKGYYDILPWILSPFASYRSIDPSSYSQNSQQAIGICALICHIIFCMSILAQLQHKIKNNTKFLAIYWTIVFLSNTFMHTVWNPSQPLHCNNILTYPFYGYLLIINIRNMEQKQRETISGDYQLSGYEYAYEKCGIGDQKMEQEIRNNKIVGLYKFIILSYFVFLGIYEQSYECCQFFGYMVAVVWIIVGVKVKYL